MLPPLRRSLLSAFTPLSRRAFSTTPIRPVARLSITGRVVAEPELIHTPAGKEIVNYTVATDTHGPRNDRQSSYFKVSMYNKEGADGLKDYLLSLSKGSLVFVEGEASIRKYEDKEGATRTTLQVVHRNIEVLRRGVPREGDESAEATQAATA
ncbi:MAG: ssDNA-binding protein, mitochondrial [Vezdaea aestivalis]|nr:MAG: ssDNA-binding protein, mitochondrial [Vezdaea aestivalis]